MLWSDKILVLIGQDKHVARYAHEFNLVYLPAMYFYGMVNATLRFMWSLGIYTVPTIIQCASSILHVLNLHIFKDYGILGIGMASIVTNLVLLVSFEIYMRYFIPEIKHLFESKNEEEGYER